jgi:hypothetical protein
VRGGTIVNDGTEHDDGDLIPEADAQEQREPVADENDAEEPTGVRQCPHFFDPKH